MVFLFVFLYLLVATAQIVVLTYFDAKYDFLDGDCRFIAFIGVFWPIFLPIIVFLSIAFTIAYLVFKLRQYFIENMK